jgi:hypothetical protein
VRLILAALAAAAALVVAELATGGLGYGGEHVRDPCKPRPALAGGGLDRTGQRVVLRGLDVAACRVRETREQLVLDLAQKGVDIGDLAKRLEGRLGGVLDWIAGTLRKVGR